MLNLRSSTCFSSTLLPQDKILLRRPHRGIKLHLGLRNSPCHKPHGQIPTWETYVVPKDLHFSKLRNFQLISTPSWVGSSAESSGPANWPCTAPCTFWWGERAAVLSTARNVSHLRFPALFFSTHLGHLESLSLSNLQPCKLKTIQNNSKHGETSHGHGSHREHQEAPFCFWNHRLRQLRQLRQCVEGTCRFFEPQPGRICSRHLPTIWLQ